MSEFTNKNIWVFIETDEGKTKSVGLELLNPGRMLAEKSGEKLVAVVFGKDNAEAIEQIKGYGPDQIISVSGGEYEKYSFDAYTYAMTSLVEKYQPSAILIGATNNGRDFAPRLSCRLRTGLTADCTSLEIGDYEDKKNNKIYHNLLYQIRPAFGGNIVATIVNPDCRPQMATVREGVMKKEIFNANHQGEIKMIDVNQFTTPEDFVIHVIERHMEKSKVNLKAAPIIVAGGYGVGSKENFQLLHELATVLGGEVGASRAAVDAGFCEHERQIGQTGTTVRPKLYIACGISGQIQHTAGMEESAMVIAINTDSNAPINKFADYVITGDLNVVIPKMIQYYKKNSK